MTLSEVLPTMVPDVALMVALPTLGVDALPEDVIVATLGLDEAHVTEAVRS